MKQKLEPRQRLSAKSFRQAFCVFVVAVAVTAALYVTLWILRKPLTAEALGAFGRRVHEVLRERGEIPYLIAFVSVLTLASVSVRGRRSRSEQRSLAAAQKVLEDEDIRTPLIYSDAPRVREKFTAEGLLEHRRSLTFDRILGALDRLEKTKSTSSMENYFRARSDLDFDLKETSYGTLRYLLWLIPALGFLGTVVGIGQAIARFAVLVGGTGTLETLGAHLPEVTHYLAIAFDTTLLGLVMSACVGLYMAHTSRKEEELLSRVDALCLDEVVSIFQEHSTLVFEMTKTLRDVAADLETVMNGNRDELTRAIGSLPAQIGPALAGVAGELRVALEGLQVTASLDGTDGLGKGVEEITTKVAGMTESLQALDASLARGLQELARGLQQEGKAAVKEITEALKASPAALITQLKSKLDTVRKDLDGINVLAEWKDSKGFEERLQRISEGVEQAMKSLGNLEDMGRKLVAAPPRRPDAEAEKPVADPGR
jgi:biopolymer transport protein ExbB/TolQ